MKTTLLGLLALYVAMNEISHATTITFTGHVSNSDVTDVDEGAYGSRVDKESTDFITTDGTHPTPNVTLLWETAAGPNADIWEFHDSSTFSILDPGTTGTPKRPTGVAQLDVNRQGGIAPADPTIIFIPDADYSVTIHSFNIGHATDMEPYEGKNPWKITLTRVSDEKEVWAHTTKILGPGDTERVGIEFKGDPGERYRLQFDRGGANHPRAGIDNLSFSQADRKPLTKKEVAETKKTLKARIEELRKELLEAKRMNEEATLEVATASKVYDDASEDEKPTAQLRVVEAREEAERREDKSAHLLEQIKNAEREYFKLLVEKVKK